MRLWSALRPVRQGSPALYQRDEATSAVSFQQGWFFHLQQQHSTVLGQNYRLGGLYGQKQRDLSTLPWEGHALEQLLRQRVSRKQTQNQEFLAHLLHPLLWHQGSLCQQAQYSPGKDGGRNKKTWERPCGPADPYPFRLQNSNSQAVVNYTQPAIHRHLAHAADTSHADLLQTISESSYSKRNFQKS